MIELLIFLIIIAISLGIIGMAKTNIDATLFMVGLIAFCFMMSIIRWFGEHQEMNLPKMNEKVKVNNLFGTITRVYPPNEYHSGRFTVLLHDKMRDFESEFWFDDYGVSVIPYK